MSIVILKELKKLNEKKFEHLNLLPFQKKSIQSLIQKRNYMSYLASLTNHSKKKKRHLEGEQFYQEVIEEAYQEYEEMNAFREREKNDKKYTN